MSKLFTGSWRTSLVGIISGVVLLLNQVMAILDADPATVFSWEQFTLALGMFGVGWFARDKNVSSEQQGVK